ncbi:unnamed protein product [Cercospora beticola]|nr:unnamed protein product [Cercospora beticola]
MTFHWAGPDNCSRLFVRVAPVLYWQLRPLSHPEDSQSDVVLCCTGDLTFPALDASVQFTPISPWRALTNGCPQFGTSVGRRTLPFVLNDTAVLPMECLHNAPMITVGHHMDLRLSLHAYSVSPILHFHR